MNWDWIVGGIVIVAWLFVVLVIFPKTGAG